MTEQDRAGKPAKELEFRAVNPKTKDVIMLQTPDLIRYHTGYNLQKKKDEDGKWNAHDPAAEESHAEDIAE